MKINRLLWKPYPVIIVGFVFTSIQPAIAMEILPDITVISPPSPLQQLINNPQLLEEEELSIAHEPSITNVLEGFPGISMTRSGYGQQSALLMRGAGGQGLVTLDDIPLLPSLPGLQNLDTLPTEALQKAEIERGPAAVYYPFQALGGAIRLYTQDREESGARLSLEGGSFGILRETLQGALSGKMGRMTMTLSRGDAFEGTHLAAAANNPEREPFRFSQGILRFSSDISSRLNWQGSMLYRNSSVGADTLGLDQKHRVAYKDDSRSFGQGETWLAQNSLNIKITPNWSSHLQLGFTQLANTVKAGALQSSMTNRMYLATLRNEYKLIDAEQQKIRWQLNWGGQARHEQGEAERSRDGGRVMKDDFGELNWGSQNLLGQAASVFGRFREERTMAAGFLETEAQYYNLSGQAGVRVEHFDQFGDHPLFKTAAAWRITPELTLRASGGTGYRIPSYTELLSLFFGNLNLKPERSASGDLSLEWFPLKNMHVTVNGYYNRYDDLITQAYDPLKGPISINVADAEVTGMELDAQYAWTDYLDTGFSYTYSDSHDLQTNRLLPSRPPHTARIWGQQKFANLPVTLWAETIARSSTWNDTANTIAIDGSVQVNASVRYAVTNQFEVYLRGENLTNNRTPQFYSIDMPGIALYGGFKLEL
jgi:vitamin B12 transporter